MIKIAPELIKPGALFMLLMLGLCLAAAPARACNNPPGTEGALRYNADHKVMQYCDGTDWQQVGESDLAAGGGGCSGPDGVEGEVIYNAEHKVMQFCNGSDWRAMGKGEDEDGGAPGGSSCNISVTADLVSRWALDESEGLVAHDMISGHDLVLSSSSSWNDTGGRLDGALQFGGAPTDISALSFGAGLLQLDKFTFCFWFNNPNNGRGGLMSAAGTWRGIYFSNTDGRIMSAWIAADTGLGAHSEPVYTYDSWNHACVSYDGGTTGSSIEFYRNGAGIARDWEQDGSGDTTATGDGYFAFGEQSSGNHFSGRLDDVLVYNDVLTPAQITQIYDDYQDCIN